MEEDLKKVFSPWASEEQESTLENTLSMGKWPIHTSTAERGPEHELWACVKTYINTIFIQNSYIN
ncbi:hypothetical protein YC2023_018482 [Brassica napus]